MSPFQGFGSLLFTLSYNNGGLSGLCIVDAFDCYYDNDALSEFRITLVYSVV
jgi:hypothetical protein